MLKEIQWDQSYETGNPLIDNAHKDIFVMSNMLVNLSDNEKYLSWIGEEGIDFLKNYVNEHFKDEEEYMLAIDYPKIAIHLEQHRKLKMEILPTIEANLNEENFSKDSILRFIKALQNWLTNHIIGFDTDLIAKKPDK